MSDFFSPTAVLMFTLAGLLDLLGWICLILDLVFGIGEVLSYIPDIIGILFFGGWTLMRALMSGKTMAEAKEEAAEEVSEVRERGERRREAIRETRERLKKKREMLQKAKEAMLKKGGRAGLRFGLAALGELIPFLGSIAPCWTIMVYLDQRKAG